jgi:hypothetical protein
MTDGADRPSRWVQSSQRAGEIPVNTQAFVEKRFNVGTSADCTIEQWVFLHPLAY